MNVKDWIEILNSKLALVAVLVASIAFTMYFVERFTPYQQDRKDLMNTINRLAAVSEELTKITQQLVVNDARQDAVISETIKRFDRHEKLAEDVLGVKTDLPTKRRER